MTEMIKKKSLLLYSNAFIQDTIVDIDNCINVSQLNI